MFKDLKNTICSNYAAYMNVVRAAERRWLVSNQRTTLWVHVYINSWGPDDVSVQLTAARAEYSSALTVGELTGRELELFMGVRRLVDRWMQNEIPELPVVLPAELTDVA